MQWWEKWVLYEIKLLFGVNMCPCCTARIKESAQYCHHCGYKFQALPQADCKHAIFHPVPSVKLSDSYREMCSHCHCVRTADEDGLGEWIPEPT